MMPCRAIVVALVLALPVSADPLTLWTDGSGVGTVELAPGVAVPARAHPCAACHGWDGGGGGEGATRAPDLGQSELVGRGYDAASFAMAVERGIAADGRALSRAMPRFDLPSTTIATLWDLTEPLEARRRYGVTQDKISFAVLYNPSDPTSMALVRAYGTALEQLDGTFWGRRLAFVPEPMERATALANDPTVFAVIGPFAPGAAERATLVSGQVPLMHGFGTFDALSGRVLTLGLDRIEELGALLNAVRDRGSSEVFILGGTAELRKDAERLIRRRGLRSTTKRDAKGVAILVLSPEIPVPTGALLAVPEAVLLARPEIAAGNDMISVSTLPFLAGADDAATVYAQTSVRVISAAVQDAGPDPTRRSVADAAQRFRDALLEEK